ncbi:MAG: protein phosphatase 2C domain-containing protein [Eubacteriales bacterium]|nr:protein phosphatase 2C domain-containing protein [Eubacteriales bacterium]
MSKELRITFSPTLEEPALTLINRRGEELCCKLGDNSFSVFGEKLINGSIETDGCSVADVEALEIEVVSGEINTDMSVADNSLSFDVHITAEKTDGDPIPRPIELVVNARTAGGSEVEILVKDAELSFKAVSAEAPEERSGEDMSGEKPEETAPVPTEAPEELPAETAESEQQTDTTSADAQPTETAYLSSPAGLSNSAAFAVGGGIGIAAALIVTAIICLIRKKKRGSAAQTGSGRIIETVPSTSELAESEDRTDESRGDVAVLYNIGGRTVQQDNFSVLNTQAGTLAVIADGMGGLQDSDKVSTLIVRCVKSLAGSVRKENAEGILYPITAKINDQVCTAIGSENLYKSGSTLVAVLTDEKRFQWVSVGDSRLYLYRAGGLIQLNREHIYFNTLLRNAVNRNIGFKEASEDAHRSNLTSFIGMGPLSELDGSRRSIAVCPGDTLLLMTDGVYNSISEESICDILGSRRSMKETARELEKRILSSQNPKQDNFTAILIHYE